VLRGIVLHCDSTFFFPFTFVFTFPIFSEVVTITTIGFLPEWTVLVSFTTVDDIVILLLVSLWNCSERALGLSLLVDVLMSMSEWTVNRFWDHTTWIMVPEQITNQAGPK
jgi:hypothetical protein